MDLEKDPLEAYDEYFDTIKESIPKSFIKLREEILLHDGDLKSVVYSTADEILTLKVHGDDGRGGRRKIELQYSGVKLFYSTSDSEKGLPGPMGYGDLGYEEIEVIEEGFEHRIRFSSGIEFKIQFSDMALGCQNG